MELIQNKDLPLQNLLDMVSPSQTQKNKILLKHNTFMISDKTLMKTSKGRPIIQINEFYELKNTKNSTMPTTQGLKTLYTTTASSHKVHKEKNSLVNLLKIDSPSKKKSKPKVLPKGRFNDLEIYSNLKTNCKEMLRNPQKTYNNPDCKLKTPTKFTMLKELEQEYYSLQKKSIENYLKGENINTQLIEMDFYSFIHLKKARLSEYLSDVDINREITPIDKIISQSVTLTSPITINTTTTKQGKELIDPKNKKYYNKLEFINELVQKQDNKIVEGLNDTQNQIVKKMQLYNQYYLNYFSPPLDNDKAFTTLKDLSLTRLSISKDLMDKHPNPISNRSTYLKLKKSYSKNFNKRRGDIHQNINFNEEVIKPDVQGRTLDISRNFDISGKLLDVPGSNVNFDTPERVSELQGRTPMIPGFTPELPMKKIIKGKGWKALGEVLEGKAGIVDSVKKKIENEGIEYVKQERDKMIDWKKDFERKRELVGDEREFLKVVKSGEFNKVEFYLIDNKKLLEIRDQIGQTPLHWAAKRGYLDIANLLIEKGADIYAEDIVKRTPKQLAFANRNQEIYSILQSYEGLLKKHDEIRQSMKKTTISGFQQHNEPTPTLYY